MWILGLKGLIGKKNKIWAAHHTRKTSLPGNGARVLLEEVP